MRIVPNLVGDQGSMMRAILPKDRVMGCDSALTGMLNYDDL